MKNPEMDPQVKKGTSVFVKFIPSKKYIFVKIGQLGRKRGLSNILPPYFCTVKKTTIKIGAEPPGFNIFGHEKSKNVPTSKKKVSVSSLGSYLPKKYFFVKIGQLGRKRGSFKYTPTLFLYHQKNYHQKQG